MNIDEITERIKERQKRIVELEMEQQIDLALLTKIDTVETSIVTVARASKEYGISHARLYYALDKGELKRVNKLGKLYLNRNEIKKVFDV